MMETSVLIQVPYELEKVYSPLEERNDIDYRLLIKLIMKQKNNEIPKELEVFWEDQYLSPVILFEMFRLFDVYAELRGRPAVYRDHPTPQERQENIFSMFKDDVPEEMNTEEGNRVLNLVLNISEYQPAGQAGRAVQDLRLLPEHPAQL